MLFSLLLICFILYYNGTGSSSGRSVVNGRAVTTDPAAIAAAVMSRRLPAAVLPLHPVDLVRHRPRPRNRAPALRFAAAFLRPGRASARHERKSAPAPVLPGNSHSRTSRGYCRS